jgi:hypothetical protein
MLDLQPGLDCILHDETTANANVRRCPPQVRREKVEIENALEQEQEFIVNKLRAELDRRQAQTRQLEEQIEQVYIWWALAVASTGSAFCCCKIPSVAITLWAFSAAQHNPLKE